MTFESNLLKKSDKKDNCFLLNNMLIVFFDVLHIFVEICPRLEKY